jgi:hypothetical protein
LRQRSVLARPTADSRLRRPFEQFEVVIGSASGRRQTRLMKLDSAAAERARIVRAIGRSQLWRILDKAGIPFSHWPTKG